MTLYDLKNKINFTFDITDDEVAASFYIELDEIPDEIAQNIEVVAIDRDLITCKLTDFLRRKAHFHPKQLREYLTESYYDGETLDALKAQLCEKWQKAKRDAGEDILDDGGEAVAHFIEHDLYDFITDYLSR
jgi:hypothetical protein